MTAEEILKNRESVLLVQGMKFYPEESCLIAMEEYSSLQCRERDERIRELEEKVNGFDENVYKVLYDNAEVHVRHFEKHISELQDKVERYEKDNEELKVLLEGALNGMLWYGTEHPESFSQADLEMQDNIKKALSSNKKVCANLGECKLNRTDCFVKCQINNKDKI